MLSKDSTPYIEFELLVGFLSFAAKVIIPGRAFLRCMFDALYNKKPWIHLRRLVKLNLT